MAIKAAELFSVDPSQAFDFGPVTPARIFNEAILPRFQSMSDEFMLDEDPVQSTPPPQLSPPSFAGAAVDAFAPSQQGFLPQQSVRQPAAQPFSGPPQTDFNAPMTDQYEDYADFMYRSEGRFGRDGALQVYAPPKGDEGGSYEVAGITARYQPQEAARLRAMIESGDTAGAEAAAKDFYRRRAAPFTRFTDNRGLQLQIADTTHHRGEGGLRRVLQRATGSDSRNYQELISGLSGRDDALDAFHAARQAYEWEEIDKGRSSREKFRKGLANRFNKAYQASLQFQTP